MRTVLLLLLSLMTGCEAVSNVKGCRDGWVDFICKYRKTNNKKVRVVIKKLKQQDFGKYQCEEQGTDYDTVKLNNDRGCQEEFIQTAYRTAKTTITCNYKGNRDESNVLFFCKENKITCEEILSTESSPKSNGTFTLTKNNTGFNVSISEVSSLHAGVYWCGVKSNEGSYRAGFRKIQLEVEGITNFTRSPTIGQNFTYWCEYPSGAVRKKFICKGEDPSICEPLVNTMQRNKNTGRFSMEDDKNQKITITVRDVTADDTGTYWCGAKSTDEKHSNPFFNRFSMTVVQTSRPPPAPPAQTPTPTPRVSSAQSTTTSTSAENNVQTSRPPAPTQTSTPTPTSRVSSAQSTTTSTSAGNSGSIITATVCVGVLLVLFVLILIFIYKRFSQSKNTRNEAAAQNIREDYEEVEEHVQRYRDATANCSTDPSGSLHYSTINFQKHSGKAGGRKAPIVKPSSSACEYSTVKCSQSPTYYNVNAPSSYLEIPLYSTVKKQKTTQDSNLERIYMV